MKKTFMKCMLALGCAASLGVVSMQADAYVYRSGYYGHRNYYSNRPVTYQRYYYRSNYYRTVPVKCGYWRYGVWHATRC